MELITLRKQVIKAMTLMMFISLIGILVACNNESLDIEPEFNFEVEDFEYINQDEETVSLDDLKGGYWVANFVFTNCVTVCPPMTANMSKLQDMAADEGLDVRFISFSVDPELDGPEDLKEYGELFDADFSNWDFLTGYSQEHIESFAARSFKSLVSKVDGFDQVNHGVSFYIVSPEGEAIHSISGTQSDEMNTIIDYLKAYTK